MRILGIAGLLLALAIVGYMIVTYMGEADYALDALRAVPGSPAESRSGRPADMTKRGLEQRLAPILDQERKRVEEANTVPDQ
jgi:hypothetical protein